MNTLIIFTAQYLFLFVIAIAILVLFKLPRKSQREKLLQLVLLGVLAFVFAKISGRFYFDPRPFTHGLKPLFYHVADNGFPSDHTVFCVSIALLVASISRKIGAILFVLALLVGSARVLANVHSPIDIIGGVVIGCVAFGVSMLIMQKLNLSQKVLLSHES